MDSTRLLQLAIGVPDAIAPDRREAAAILILRSWLTPEAISFDEARHDSMLSKALDDVRANLDAGELDPFLVAADDSNLDARHPDAPQARGKQQLMNLLVRALVSYSRAHPVLDDAATVEPPRRRPGDEGGRRAIVLT